MSASTTNRPGPLTRITDDVWSVQDFVPGRPIPRAWTVVRLGDGALVFFNGFPVHAETLAALRALGTPRHLIVPNRFHALQVEAFARELGLQLWAHPVTLDALTLPNARSILEFPPDPSLELFTVEGFRTKETVLRFREVLVVADLVTNVPHAWSPAGLVMRALGFSGPSPRLPRPVRARVEVDPGLVKQLLNALAAAPLRHLVPSHGLPMEGDVGGALRAIAHTL